MTAREILLRAEETGVTLSALGCDLKYCGPGRAVAALLGDLRCYKAELLRLLNGTRPTPSWPIPTGDDRRSCAQCRHLNQSGRCLAARRGKMQATARYYRPVPDIPRRCEGYAPKPDDPDQRGGHERWPGLAVIPRAGAYDT